MCIRDRTRRRLGRKTRMVEAGQARVALEVFGDPERVVALPVSYTHLRAHETVLELVCRLLLEKKKNSKQYYKLRKSSRMNRSHSI